MARIVGNLPVKTRLPLEAWALAGLVTLFSLVCSLTHIPLTHQSKPSVEQANAAYNCPAYQAALKVLGDGAVRDLRIVAGLE